MNILIVGPQTKYFLTPYPIVILELPTVTKTYNNTLNKVVMVVLVYLLTNFCHCPWYLKKYFLLQKSSKVTKKIQKIIYLLRYPKSVTHPLSFMYDIHRVKTSFIGLFPISAENILPHESWGRPWGCCRRGRWWRCRRGRGPAGCPRSTAARARPPRPDPSSEIKFRQIKLDVFNDCKMHNLKSFLKLKFWERTINSWL